MNIMPRRKNFSLPPASVRRLEKLVKLTNAMSEAEVMRQALYTHEVIAQWIAEGVRFTATMPDGTQRDVDFCIDVQVEP